MSSLDILVLSKDFFGITEEDQKEIHSIAPDCKITAIDRDNASIDQIKRAEIILGPPDIKKLKYAENLRWLQLMSAGADGYTDRSIYFNRSIILTNLSGVYGPPIAEHVLSMILAFIKNLHIHMASKVSKTWNRIGSTKNFYGSTLGVIGLGDIGNEVAKRAHALGARVIAVKRVISSVRIPYYVDELYGEEWIDALMQRSDYIVLALPDTEKTKGIINRERINKMKPDAFIINVGRGSIIDQDALIQALEEHRIAGAGLDVTTPEPLPVTSKLWTLSNVILTYHSAGTSFDNSKGYNRSIIENLRLYLQGKPLMNLVDFDEGY